MPVFSDRLQWHAARAYAWLYCRVRAATGRNLRGLGWMLRRIRHDRVFRTRSLNFHFDHRVAGAYGRMIAGEFNEPETHALLSLVLSRVRGVTFIDVGANIGEFLVPAAAHPSVLRAIGFEPHGICAAACETSLQLNGVTGATVVREVIGDGTHTAYAIDEARPNASGFRDGAPATRTLRLDDVLCDATGPIVLLIDVEGAEPLVLRGATRLIQQTRPLIIFEYNDVSRRCFGIDEIAAILGAGYHIHRLREDGGLDGDVAHAWNCVAIPDNSMFHDICQTVRR